MRPRIVTLTGTAAAAAVVAMVSVAGQAPPSSAPANFALETSWGEPDLQGVWGRSADDALPTPREVRRS